MSSFAAVVLSAGSGKRMKSDIPKQYMDLNGKPVIYYSLKAFEDNGTTPNNNELIYVSGTGNAEIYGGTFANGDGKFVLNQLDADRATSSITVLVNTVIFS